MAIHKGESAGKAGERPRIIQKSPARLAALCLPVACLVAYAAGLPLPLPRFLVPRASYSTRLASVESILRDAAGRFASVRIDTGAGPTLDDIAAARRHYSATGMPVAFSRTERAPGPLAAYSLAVTGDGSPSTVTLLVDEEAAAGPIRVSVGGSDAVAAARAPADRRFSFPVQAPSGPMLAGDGPGGSGGGDSVEIRLESGPPGSSRLSAFTVSSPSADRPRILMATRTPGRRSVIEALRPVRKIGYGELSAAGLYDYELLVLDGPVLPELEGGVAAAIEEYVRRGAGSLLVAVDSPELGRTGDCRAIEELLPVELSPRSLSRLPDVAMAVAIDVSGSMYGDKLSLAKAVGLELMGNLKPSDAAGIILFDEEARWLYPLAPVSELDAMRTLAPLKAGGGTRMLPALEECLSALEASTVAERRIVVVSDGISAPGDFDALAARAFRSGIAISAMAVGGEYDKALLTRISAGSGGRFYRVKDSGEVPSLIVEDRKSVSRTVFAEERVGVVDIAGAPAGTIEGMARLGAKPDAVAFFSSEAGDPLFAARRIGARSSLVFASDLYGRFDKDFLERPESLSVLGSVLGGLFNERPPSAVATETADGLSLSIGADYLVAPRAALADDRGRVVRDAPFDGVGPGRFYASFGRLPEGRYTALVEDRGRAVARFALYSNGGTAAAPSDSAAAALAYRTPFWALPRAGSAWLIAFFILSLASSVALRMRR
ncbi:MAG: VWA domain-containing protein [Spirochaetes bacterium]|nr:VWA domain-containing protein [Spirochaetota bacterium]MBU1079571.1 VWA domain-containing protein [Spirochaetota bacterium]